MGNNLKNNAKRNFTGRLQMSAGVFLVPSSKCPVPGAQCVVLCALCIVYSTKFVTINRYCRTSPVHLRLVRMVLLCMLLENTMWGAHGAPCTVPSSGFSYLFNLVCAMCVVHCAFMYLGCRVCIVPCGMCMCIYIPRM